MSTTTGTATSTRARVPLEHPGSLLARLVNAWSRREYGLEAEPAKALLHQPKVLMAVGRLGTSAQKKWSRCDTGLKELASLLVASRIGCGWCMDYGYWLSHTHGLPVEKLQQVLDWQHSEVYTPLERQVLEYADAMTATPPTVTDEMVARLREELDDAQLVELTGMIAAENFFARTNSALGLGSQGFSDRCALPPR